jgi:cytochrome c2
VVKLSGILGGAAVLLVLTLVARAQGVGDAQRGARVFTQCRIYHSLEAGKNMVGPSLHGLIGRKAGSVPGYAHSPAMKNANVTSSARTGAVRSFPRSGTLGSRSLPGLVATD